MMRIPRFGGTTWLAVTVALLLPALAWLQYDWANQLAAASRERRERTLRAAGAQFTAAVDAEIGRLGASLQLDGAMVERRDWDAYALRYETALTGGAGELVSGVWFVELDDLAAPDRRLVMHAWNEAARAFEPTGWTDALLTLRERLEAQPARRTPPGRSGPREIFGASSALGDDRTLVMPVVSVRTPRPGEPVGDRFTTDVRLRGYTVVRLNMDVLARERLPQLVEEYFPAASEYRVAIVANDDDRVLFESSAGAAAETAETPDLTTSFMQLRVSPMMVLAQIEPGGPGLRGQPAVDLPPPSPPDDLERAGRANQVTIEMRSQDGERTVRTRTFTHPHGHWTLRVKHEAGSLEAAVAASRRRNLGLSGGVLALLGVVVALIAVSARRAQALARRQMEFVAAVSHELRTPVAVINSAAGNLADGVVGDPVRVKRYGVTIQAEARRLGETVERVLQLAGLGSGRPLPMAPVSAESVVRDAVRMSEADAAQAAVAVQVELAPEVPALVGDAGALQSAVQNLVGNAIKYAGDDRWVRVTVSTTRTPRHEVRIAVEDHGSGLDAEEQRLVFEPFFRGRAAIANQVKGSGLGLSLVRRIAEAHGGRVELVSSPDHGSTFTICLPAAPDVPVTAATATAAPQTATS